MSRILPAPFPASSAPLFCLFVVIAGCEPARRYPEVTVDSPQPKKPASLPAEFLWLEPSFTVRDTPIEFVDAASDEWQNLRPTGNNPPPLAAGMRTAHLGQSPLAAALWLLVTNQMERIRIKVPLGLPDPTPFIPNSNPPTRHKRRLGERLFFDTALLFEKKAVSCAGCHRPEHGYSFPFEVRAGSREMNPPSLLNCVYNQHQFWDGRVRTLEEVIEGDLEESDTAKTGKHAWPGLVKRLRASKSYQEEFQKVFGISEPTLDAAAKALATYLRTLLVGNSLFDRAVHKAGKRGPEGLLADDFKGVLDEDPQALGRLGMKEEARPELNDKLKAKVARKLLSGHRLFVGEALCFRCHNGWNFKDNSFHNIGIRESDQLFVAGEEPGRFRALVVGLKDERMIGAFRTPSLRNLALTAPYFHDGQAATLRQVVDYYNKRLSADFNKYLDPELLAAPGKARQLELHHEDTEALVLYLRALDGELVAGIAR
jgi:cytochrome c peroxidase